MFRWYTLFALFVSTTPVFFSLAFAREHRLCIQKFSGVQLDDATIDTTVQAATVILLEAGQQDPSCNGVSLGRDGSVSSWNNELPRSLAGSSDFAKLVSTPCVKVVQRISWCGGPLFAGGALGCSPIPGNSMVVTASYASFTDAVFAKYRPITLLHELGHNLGLQHSTDSTNIMTPGISPTTTKFAHNDCLVYSAQDPAALLASRVGQRAAAALPKVLPGNAVTDRPDAVTSPMPIEEFVKQPFTKTSISQAQNYRKDVKSVEQMLTEPSFGAYRNNVVGLLAVIGTVDSIQAVDGYLKTPIRDAPSGPELLAHLAGLTTIGAIANRLGVSDKRVEVLKVAQDPGFWVPLLDQSKLTPDDLEATARDLSIQAVHAYAITGSKKASVFLKNMKVDAQNAAIPQDVRKDKIDVLDQALKLHNLSASKGALEVFGF